MNQSSMTFINSDPDDSDNNDDETYTRFERSFKVDDSSQTTQKFTLYYKDK